MVFRFFKRRKKEILPPSLEELPSDLPDLSSFPSLKEEKMKMSIEEQPFPELELPLLETPPQSILEIRKAVEEGPVPTKIARAPVFKVERPEKIPEVKRRIKERRVFMRIERYKAILGALNSVKASLADFNTSLQKFDNTNSNQGVNFEKWESALNTVQKKIIAADKKLSK